MAVNAFGIVIQNMSRLGFFQFLFPFLLALAIIYGLLRWALKEQIPKSAAGLISLIFAFFVMLYTSWNTTVVNFFANLSGAWLVVASGLLFIIILLGLVGFDVKKFTEGKYSKWVLALLLIAIGLVIFLGAGGAWFVNVPGFALNSDFWTVLFFIVILAIVMFWLGQEGEGGDEGGSGEGGGH